MREAQDDLMDEVNAARQTRLLKWVDVAKALHKTTGHLRKIRAGDAPITSDVAAAIDLFLGKPHGTSWAKLTRDAAPMPAPAEESAGAEPIAEEPADAEPTDEELAEMTNRQIARLAIKYQNERGPEARRDFLQRAKAARDRAVDTLVAESSDASA